MPTRITLIALFIFVSAFSQVQKVGYDEKNNFTLLYYSVKGIDTVKIPGNWERDKRDLATSVYLKNPYNEIGFYIDTKSKKYKSAATEAEAMKLYSTNRIKKIKKAWEVDLLATDNESYQLYKIRSARHPDGNQIGLFGTRGNYVYNIVCYGAIDDNLKIEFLIKLFQNTKP
ncbi:hypothetical protein [Flavobacterium sp.]|uniref:hypothetical protein n=1 Tax=Flavobacterium sp. TaxID=239 RepID=UPI0011FA9874|nr:hypothetical protein [Flavobacterium sp.]RZJ71418.1 MAG: hypothetical protein EOO49_10175 [Flavobacterium sp.]